MRNQASEPLVTVDSEMQKVVSTDGDLLEAWRGNAGYRHDIIVLTGQTQRKGPAQGLCFCKVPEEEMSLLHLWCFHCHSFWPFGLVIEGAHIAQLKA